MKTKIDRPIFILGSARSGTTILQEVMCSHPDLAFVTDNLEFSLRYHDVKPELINNDLTGIIIENKTTKQKLGSLLGRQVKLDVDRVEYYKKLEQYNKKGHNVRESGGYLWQWTKEKYYDETDITKELIRYVRDGIQFSLDVMGKNRFLDKNPEYCMQTKVMEKMFPDAKYIHIIREPEPVVYSLYLKEFWMPTAMNMYVHEILGDDYHKASSRLFNYVLAYKKYTDLARTLNDYIEITYNDLINDTEKTIAKLCSYCELDNIKFDYPEIIKNNDEKWKKMFTDEQKQDVVNAKREAGFE